MKARKEVREKRRRYIEWKEKEELIPTFSNDRFQMTTQNKAQ